MREAGPLAGVLWRTLRLVTAWTAASPEARTSLFTPETSDSLATEAGEASLPEPARLAVLTVAAELARGEDAAPKRLADACDRLATWAAHAYMPSAAADFAAAAAAALPASPGYARAAGDAFRRVGRYPEAAALYERAAALARHARDWACYVHAHAELGRVAQLRGDLAGARRSLERAGRRAARHGHAELHAGVLHELFRLERRIGSAEGAELRGAEAAARYPVGHAGLHELAAEAVALWLEARRHEDAYPVLARLAMRGEGPARVRALGALARSAAELGEDAAARAALQALLELPLGAEGRAHALLEAGEGALVLGWLEDAETASRAALGSATRCGEPAAATAARSLLTRAAARRAVGPVAVPRRPIGPRSPLSTALAAALDGGPG